jgi:hypothetical protein
MNSLTREEQAPTGTRVEFAGFGFFWFAEGKIVEE